MAASRYAVVARLADDLAHEIKNPLSSIVINLEVMRQKLRKGETGVVLERTNAIEQELHRVHQLVDGLLRLLRPQKDGPGPYSVADTVSAVAPLLLARARSADVEFTFGEVPLEAYTVVSPDALRFALVTCGLRLIDVAQDAAGTVHLRSEVSVGAITLDVRASTATPASVPAADDAAVGELFAAAGGQWSSVGGHAVHLRLPLAKR